MMRFLLGVAWAVFAVMFDACAIWLVWGWHGVPLGLPALSLARAAGVSSMVSLFVFRVGRDEGKALIKGIEEHDFLKRVKGSTDATEEEIAAIEEGVKDRDKRETHILWARRGLLVFAVTALVAIAKIAAMLAR